MVWKTQLGIHIKCMLFPSNLTKVGTY